MVRKVNSLGEAWPFTRISGLAGLGFAIAILSGNALLVPAGLPINGGDPAEVVEFFAAERSVVRLVSALGPIIWALSTVFAAGAVSALWRSDRARGTAWSLVGFAGVLLQNATFTGVMATRLALASTTAPDGGTTAGLWALHNALFIFNGTFLALAMTGLSISGRRAGLIRRWHAGIGLLAAALQLASAVLSPLFIDDRGPVGLVGLAGWLLWIPWIVGYAVALIRLAPVAGEDGRVRRGSSVTG